MKPKILLRAVTSAFLAAGLLSASLYAGLSGSAQAGVPAVAPRYYAEGEMPAYRNTGEYPMGDGMSVNGLPIRLSYFQTSDNADKVRDFYVTELARQSPVKVQKTPDGYVVSTFDIRRDEQKSVVIVRQGEETIVFPTIAPGALNDAEQALPEDLPASSRAIRLSDVRTNATDDNSAVITYHEPDSAALVVAESLKRMEARGWHLRRRHDPAGDLNVTTLDLSRPGRSAVLSVLPLKTQPGSTVVFQMNRSMEAEQ